MFRTPSSDTQPGDEEDVADLPIPTLGPIDREEPDLSEQPSIIRDFAYSAENVLFWRLEEPPDLDPPIDSGRSDPDNAKAQFGGIEEGGFTGTPPWLQSTDEDDQSEEEQLTSSPDDELHGRAVALFDFAPEHENEFALQEGQVIYISSRHGLGWLVAVDIHHGECGLVPEEYVRLLEPDEAGFSDHEHDAHAAYKALSPTKAAKDQEYVKDPATQDEDQSEWVDDLPELTGDDHIDNKGESGHSNTAASDELTNAQRQEILDAAEREMSLNEAKFREDF